MQIEIGFSKSKKCLPIGSWLIRAYLCTPYSHVYIKFHSESLNRTIIYEAVGHGGVRFVGSNIWKKQAKEVESFIIDVKKCNYTFLMQELIDNSGVTYGFMQNIGIVLANVFNMKSNPWKKGMNCSELVAIILKSEGYNIDKPLDLVTPKDIYNVLKK